MTTSPVVNKTLEWVIGDILHACQVGLGTANLQVSGGSHVEDLFVSIAVCDGSGVDILSEGERNGKRRTVDLIGGRGSRIDQRDTGCADCMNNPHP